MKFETNPNIKQETLDYVKEKVERSLNEDMPISYKNLVAICEENEKAEWALSEMLKYATKYVVDVWDMKLLVKEKNKYTDDEWAEKLAAEDDARTRLHNTYIDSIAILSRILVANDLENEWVRSLMSPSENKLNRAACGRFAIMLVYSMYVNNELET